MIKKTFFTILMGTFVGLAANSTLASGSYAFDAFSTCTTNNCQAQRLRGYYTSSGTGPNSGGTSVLQVFAKAGECLRLNVIQANSDLEMAVVSPDPALGSSIGNVWANDDDFDTFSPNPLIKVDPVPRTGRYTIVVSTFSTGTGNTGFTLAYGRYNTGNNNCLNPTTNPAVLSAPSSVEEEEQIKSSLIQ